MICAHILSRSIGYIVSVAPRGPTKSVVGTTTTLVQLSSCCEVVVSAEARCSGVILLCPNESGHSAAVLSFAIKPHIYNKPGFLWFSGEYLKYIENAISIVLDSRLQSSLKERGPNGLFNDITQVHLNNSFKMPRIRPTLYANTAYIMS